MFVSKRRHEEESSRYQQRIATLEQQLTSSEVEKGRAEAIVSAMAAPMFTVDRNLKVTSINDAALSALGYRREEVVGKMDCAELSKTPLCGTSNCTLKNCMADGRPIIGQTVAKTRDGHELPIQAACSPLIDTDGLVYGGMEVIIDQSAAVKATRRCENVLASIAAPMFVVDKELTITSINDSALQALGYRSEEVVGKMSCAELARTPLCGTGNCTIKNCMKTGQPIVGTTVAKARDGHEIPIQAACSALFDEDGTLIGGMEVIIDQTELVRTQRESENILTTIAAPMFVVDKELTIKSINDAALTALGYRREEVVGKMSCAELSRTPLCNTENCTLKNCMKSGETIFGETVAEARDGHKIPIQAACSALFDEAGNPYGGIEVIIDITEIKRLEQEANEQKAYLERQVQMLVASLEQFAQGDLAIELVAERDDEIARIIENLKIAVASIVELARAAERISLGDTAVEVTPRSAKDILGHAFVSMVDAQREKAAVLERIAHGDLTVEFQVSSAEDTLGHSLKLMVEKLNEVVANVKLASDNVASGSQQMSSGSEEMSQGATEQAAAAEEASSSMEQMAANIRQNADNALQTEKIAV
ncbi:MAG TPA: PAS domain S-box protein, partial [Desulfuromonadales bacterium]|nr:PAS domain S-box protein [Desulfuromonadales bacterium]